ncbi:hypothetical protein AB205_0178940 [Aquarana catesbeiana]|uniref:Uncharacterized protein n=1 Tax=Aquarana catesbeiana TaxID=8400 RepID=A0A2G9P1T4_AQUCT|nr:hypothetical protein AB205_0178940 [Aquarana catesbeiana]
MNVICNEQSRVPDGHRAHRALASAPGTCFGSAHAAGGVLKSRRTAMTARAGEPTFCSITVVAAPEAVNKMVFVSTNSSTLFCASFHTEFQCNRHV